MSMRRPIGEANEVFEEPDLKGRPVDDLEDQHLGQREEGGEEEDGVACLELFLAERPEAGQAAGDSHGFGSVVCFLNLRGL